MRIALLGDIALFGRFCRKRNRDVLTYIDRIADYLQEHDVIVANLETPFAEGFPPRGSKSAHIRSSPENIEILKHLGITHVSLANNHMGDYGLSGFRLTRKLLEKANIDYFGIGRKICRIDDGNCKVALLGYCSYNSNPLLTSDTFSGGVNTLDVKRVLTDVETNRSEGYFNILSIHSGEEHVPMPSQEDIRFARGLAKRGKYVYYGHHPHVIQGIEEYLGSLIFYSLGNFLFDDVYSKFDRDNPLIKLSDANKTGLIASLQLSENQVTDWQITPLYLGNEKMLIGNEVINFSMKAINAHLVDAEGDGYTSRRLRAISEYLSKRKAQRNLTWYLRRLDMSSFGIILNSRKNKFLQNKHFSTKLKYLD